ncbi:DUF58 domain-containing protein [Planctomicrobium sp. SH664]|uniref:DUF58 domain-containing protein n=1 Tax=Planctomicrobium sp. SH664 TaxID=3448125 RepID=UPI003F5C7739
MSADIPLHDPSALARFGQLEVVARLIVEGFMLGQHKSPFKGTSVEFVEHRQYYPGDEVRHIDWRAYGKTGKYYIKEFEEETNLRATLLLDASGSMGYGASTASKFAYGRTLAAALAYLLHSQRDAVGLVTFDTRERVRVEPSTHSKNLGSLMASLQNCQPGGESSLGTFLQKFVPSLKRRSLVCLISDFFDDLNQLQAALSLFRRNRHEVILMQVIAPEEADFPFTRPTQFRSLERAAERILVDPHRLRSVYLEQFQAFQAELKSLAGRSGFDLVPLTTTDDYATALGAYLNWRTNRARRGSS